MPSAKLKLEEKKLEPASIDEIISLMLAGEISRERALELIHEFRARNHSLIERLTTSTTSGS